MVVLKMLSGSLRCWKLRRCRSRDGLRIRLLSLMREILGPKIEGKNQISPTGNFNLNLQVRIAENFNLGPGRLVQLPLRII